MGEEIARDRARLELVTSLLAEQERRPTLPNAHVQQAFVQVTERLTNERGNLLSKLLDSLRRVLNSTATQLAQELGLTEEQGQHYRDETFRAASSPLQERGGFGGPESIPALDKAIQEQADLLRWVRQAKGLDT